MINPLKDPPSRRTTHGAVMSTALARRWTWLQANGVSLTDFSTDECVAREMPKLIGLQAELEKLIADHPEPPRYLTDVLGELRCLMRRSPAARVKR